MDGMNTVRRSALALATAVVLGLGTSLSAHAAGSESGKAAVYTVKLHGHKTASGERYDKEALTAAHKTLPFGTKVKVTNTKNQKSVVLRINDRGPVQADRVLDISSKAARSLGMHPRGMAEVTMDVVAEAPARKKKG